MLIRDLVLQLRVQQWVKNVLVVVSPLAAHSLLQPDVLRAAVLVFGAFCAVASGIYVINDLFDLEADRAHPRKRNRPFASGRLPLAFGALGPILLAAGLLVAFRISVGTGIILATYVIVSVGYSVWLKTKPLVDVFALSALYTLRVLAGGQACDIPPSAWLLLFSGFLFLSLAFLKRVTEYKLRQARQEDHENRRDYSSRDIELLQQFGVSSSFISTLVLGLYFRSDRAAHEYDFAPVLWAAIPVLLFWQARMWLAQQRGKMTDDPIVFAAQDRVSLLCLLSLAGIYFVASFD